MTLKKLVMLCNEIIFKSSLDIKTLSFKLQPWSPLTDQLYSVVQFAKSKRLLIYFFNMEKMCIINTNCRIYKHYEWHYHPLFSMDADGLWTNNVLYRNCIQMLIPMSKQELPAIPGGRNVKRKGTTFITPQDFPALFPVYTSESITLPPVKFSTCERNYLAFFDGRSIDVKQFQSSFFTFFLDLICLNWHLWIWL